MMTTSAFKRRFVRFSGMRTLQSFVLPIVAILVSFLVAALILASIGAEPGKALASMFQGSGLLPKARYGGGQSQLTDFMSLVNNSTPMIFAALAVAVALKGGLFNIGVSGQMILSGFVATVVVGYSHLPPGTAKVLVVLITLAVGALAGALMGFLKYRFNINEVVQSIMFNYIFFYVTDFFIYQYFLNATTRSSNAVSDASRLTLMDVPLGKVAIVLPLGFVLVMACCLFVSFFLRRTKAGFEIKAVGLNQRCSRYAGISIPRNVVLAMAISGALAGLAGGTYFLGATNTMKPAAMISTGFDAIAVTLLGNSNPFGIVLAAFLISGMTTGSAYMQARSGVSTQIPSLIIGLLLLFAACTGFLRRSIEKTAMRFEEELSEGREEA